MSVRDANAFIEKLKSDPNFATQVVNAQSDTTLQLAKTAGLTFSQQEMVAAQKARAEAGEATANTVVEWVGVGVGTVGAVAGAVAAAATAAAA
jgi:predicted ribosomally synthesized peptide with nif11-like leader